MLINLRKNQYYGTLKIVQLNSMSFISSFKLFYHLLVCECFKMVFVLFFVFVERISSFLIFIKPFR